MKIEQYFCDIQQNPGFSDLRLAEGECPRFRASAGVEVYQQGTELSRDDLLEFLKASDPHRKWIDEIDKNGDVDFGAKINNTRVRGNAFYYCGDKKLGIALRKTRSEPPLLEEIHLPLSLTEWLVKKSGLILVCGPTGSGKTTTLAAMVHWINCNEACHIVTLEDPIEYIHQSRKSVVTQRQINTDLKTYARGIRAAMRQDPDVLLIGEIRDRETAEAAFQAAETGHLVLATLHASSAAKVVERLVDFFDPSEKPMISSLTASVLVGVMTQTMLTTKNSERRVAYELMSNELSIATTIRAGKLQQIPNLLQTQGGTDKNIIPLNKTLAELYRSGLITQETAIRASLDPKDLENRIVSRYGRT